MEPHRERTITPGAAAVSRHRLAAHAGHIRAIRALVFFVVGRRVWNVMRLDVVHMTTKTLNWSQS